MIIKHRLSDLDPLGPVTASLGLATVLLLPAALASAPTAMPSADAIVSVVVLGIVCSALGFLLFFALIAEVGPGRATVITYVNPVVAAALGVHAPGRAPRPDRRRRPAADPRRLLALHGRPDAAVAAVRGATAAGGGGAAPAPARGSTRASARATA